MQRAIVILVLLLAVLGGLAALGVFDPSSQGPDDDPPMNGTPNGTTPDRPNNGGSSGNGSNAGKGTGFQIRTPKDMPKPEQLRLTKLTRVLFIANRKGTQNRYMMDQLPSIRGMAFHVWFVSEEKQQGPAHGLDPLTAAPTAVSLGAKDYALLVIDDFDPTRMTNAFWTEVKDRVEGGSMGLIAYVSAQPLPVQPFLAHPILKTLLPVAKCKPITHDPSTGRVAGSFKERRPFKITTDGQNHIALRMSKFPKWSRSIWEFWGDGKGRLETKFGYPVVDLAPGARVLLSIDGGGDPDVPVVIVGDEAKGRVMWIGTPEWGWDAHYNTATAARMARVVRNTTIWAAGGVEE